MAPFTKENWKRKQGVLHTFVQAELQNVIAVVTKNELSYG